MCRFGEVKCSSVCQPGIFERVGRGVNFNFYLYRAMGGFIVIWKF